MCITLGDRTPVSNVVLFQYKERQVVETKDELEVQSYLQADDSVAPRYGV